MLTLLGKILGVELSSALASSSTHSCVRVQFLEAWWPEAARSPWWFCSRWSLAPAVHGSLQHTDAPLPNLQLDGPAMDPPWTLAPWREGLLQVQISSKFCWHRTTAISLSFCESRQRVLEWREAPPWGALLQPWD